ncbi:MAG: DnaJ domain-containing protein [Leptolyngbyaceae cyanobacterium bins.59]|nr:DnaJ domain-containing protein [Leptolyngbyaceae cyanobacterium bins.59]
MAFQIQRGLFSLDFVDHHAILGVAMDADAKEVRKRYLKVARNLHPDSITTTDPEERQLANDFLSKMVNPAYEKLSQEKERAEYNVLIKLKGQQAVRQQSSFEITGELAKQLSTATDVDQGYKEALKQLAEKQYQQLAQMTEITGEISELNLVYLMRKTTKGEPLKPATPKPATPAPASSKSPQAAPPPPPAVNPKEALTEQYYRRANDHFNNGNLAQATLELREALQISPNSAKCHSLLGAVYLKQKQGTMAKIHFNKALGLNPHDEIAKKGLQQVEKLAGGATKPTPSSGQPKASNQKSDKPNQSGGGFFGLFGGKKK